jgi:hypothetical protein
VTTLWLSGTDELLADIQLLAHGTKLPQERMNRLLAAATLARQRPAQLRFGYLGGQRYLTARGPWTCAGDGSGAALMMLAVHNPNQPIELLHDDTSLRAWRERLSRALDSLAQVDADLATALSSARRPNAPGIRFSEGTGGVVTMRWRPPPGLQVIGAFE